jgi:hypothetical protein
MIIGVGWITVLGFWISSAGPGGATIAPVRTQIQRLEVRLAIGPPETQPELIVDPDAVLAGSLNRTALLCNALRQALARA